MADRKTTYRQKEQTPFGVKASTTIDAGKMVAIDSTGYAVEASDTAGIVVVGMADDAVDNSTGADGAKNVLVRRNKAFLFKNDATNPVVQSSMFQNVIVKDSSTVTVAAGATNDIVAGKCTGIEAGGVWVEI